jgi:hypothetical protein
MAANSGAGASVSSGAGYQARIGAYLLVTHICGVSSDITKDRKILSVGFETTESVDDINVTLADGAVIFIQAKAKIDFSVLQTSELRSVFEQFERQNRIRANTEDQYFLITSGRSSRKVTYDMRAALEAFRLGPETYFRRDQPRALVQIVDDLLALIRALQVAAGQPPDDDVARAVIRKTFVSAMDIEAGDAIEQGVHLLLQSRDFASPAALWGKIVTDCLSHAKARHTVDVANASALYERFQIKSGQIPEQASDDLLRIEFGKMDIAVGREVMLCRFSDESMPTGPVVMELYRFDDDCRERVKFEGNTCKLQNGATASLIRRAATYTGLMRLIEADPNLVGGEAVTLFPINSKDDYEKGLCAESHRERLKQAALANSHPLHCIHCGNPISSNNAPVVESGREQTLTVGLSHEACLAPDDRVLGSIRCQFFEEHPELIHFDPNAWFVASHNGQMTFHAAEFLRSQPFLAWGGRRRRGPPGPFVVEMQLQGGGREIVTSRNEVDRFSKADATDFVARLNTYIHERGYSDPLCYTEQTKSFGPRSTLIEQFGGRERLLLVEGARARSYDQRFAARYTRPGNWYAPLFYLRDLSIGEPFSILGSIVLLTTPLSLVNHLDNWREAHIPIPNYETVSILTDRDFDDFMLWLEGHGRNVIVDPMVKVDTSARFISGIPIRSVESIVAGA